MDKKNRVRYLNMDQEKLEKKLLQEFEKTQINRPKIPKEGQHPFLYLQTFNNLIGYFKRKPGPYDDMFTWTQKHQEFTKIHIPNEFEKSYRKGAHSNENEGFKANEKNDKFDKLAGKPEKEKNLKFEKSSDVFENLEKFGKVDKLEKNQDKFEKNEKIKNEKYLAFTSKSKGIEENKNSSEVNKNKSLINNQGHFGYLEGIDLGTVNTIQDLLNHGQFIENLKKSEERKKLCSVEAKECFRKKPMYYIKCGNTPKLGYKKENWLELSSERSASMIKNYEANLLSSEKLIKHRRVFNLSRLRDRKMNNASKTCKTENFEDLKDDFRDKYYLNPFDMRNYCLNKIISKMDSKKIEELDDPLGKSDHFSWNHTPVETPTHKTKRIFNNSNFNKTISPNENTNKNFYHVPDFESEKEIESQKKSRNFTAPESFNFKKSPINKKSKVLNFESDDLYEQPKSGKMSIFKKKGDESFLRNKKRSIPLLKNANLKNANKNSDIDSFFIYREHLNNKLDKIFKKDKLENNIDIHFKKNLSNDQNKFNLLNDDNIFNYNSYFKKRYFNNGMRLDLSEKTKTMLHNFKSKQHKVIVEPNSPPRSGRYYPDDQSYFIVTPLSREFYGNILKYEEKINSKNYSIETLNEMISLYAKCVEHYDSLKDPIKFYFLEKIQLTLVNKSSLDVMIAQENKSHHNISARKKMAARRNKGKNIERIDSCTETEEEMSTKKKEPKINQQQPLPTSRENNKIETEITPYNIAKKKMERSKKLNLYLELQEKNEKEQENLPVLIQGYEQESFKNDKLVHNNLKSQLDLIKQKLEKRKKLNMMKQSYAFSTSFLSENFNSSILEDINNSNKENSPIESKYQKNNILDESHNEQNILSTSLLLSDFNIDIPMHPDKNKDKGKLSNPLLLHRFSCEVNPAHLHEFPK